jgi:hypothetical protein
MSSPFSRSHDAPECGERISRDCWYASAWTWGRPDIEVVAMCGRMGVRIVLALAGVLMTGCASTSDARYVYQDGEFGVVAIPRNTPQDAHHYREQAEALMAHHFPQGYEIVRAEEVPQGSRTLTVGQTGTSELAPAVTPHLLALLKIGGSMTRNQADTLSLTECRIIYKKAEHPEAVPTSLSTATATATPTEAVAYAPDSTQSPACYLDPNLEARKKAGEPVKVETAKKAPDSTRTAASPAITGE